MAWTRSRTVRWMWIFLLLQCALLGGCLVLEIQSTGGESATISHVMRQLWASSDGPWIVLIVSHMIGMPVWFLVGHWFGAGKETYQALRDKPSSTAGILVRSEDHAVEEYEDMLRQKKIAGSGPRE